jgi:hypothetical protein
VVISGFHDYSLPEVQEGMERLLSQLENTTFIDPLYTESWLRDFLDYVRRNKDYSPIDISDEQKFIKNLNSVIANPTIFNSFIQFNLQFMRKLIIDFIIDIFGLWTYPIHARRGLLR